MNHALAASDLPMDRDIAYQRVRQRILSRTLAAGSALSERGLSEELGLGRTPVREAIKSLAQEGFLEIVPMRGTFVRQLNLQDLREIHEVRLGLEGIASVLAAQRGPTSELQACAEQLRSLQDSRIPSTSEAAQRLGWQFHEAIFRAAGNQRLLKLYGNLRAQSGMALQHNENYDAVRIPEAVREHLQIYLAIETGDVEAAQRLTWDHLNHALQTKLRMLTSP